MSMLYWMCSKASPVNLVCDIVLRKYVFSRLKADTFLSHSNVVIGKVENILRHSVIIVLHFQAVTGNIYRL